MRVYISKKEASILNDALKEYHCKGLSELNIVKKLLNKIKDCENLQVTQNRKVK